MEHPEYDVIENVTTAQGAIGETISRIDRLISQYPDEFYDQLKAYKEALKRARDEIEPPEWFQQIVDALYADDAEGEAEQDAMRY